MFAKNFIFILLGTTIVLANPIQENKDSDVLVDDVKTRGIFDTFQSWWIKTDETFKKILQLVLDTGNGVMDYSKEKFSQLMIKYYEIKGKSEENLNQIKNEFIQRLIGRMQKIIDALRNQSDTKTLEELKQKTQEIAELNKGALKKLQQKLQQAIEAEKQKLEQNLGQWKKQADKAVNK